MPGVAQFKTIGGDRRCCCAAVAVAKNDAFQQASSFELLFSRLVADVAHTHFLLQRFFYGLISAVAVVQDIHRQLAKTPVPRGAGLQVALELKKDAPHPANHWEKAS